LAGKLTGEATKLIRVSLVFLILFLVADHFFSVFTWEEGGDVGVEGYIVCGLGFLSMAMDAYIYKSNGGSQN